jgi:hypothetical protein
MSKIAVDYNILNQRGTPAWFSANFADIPTAGVTGRMFISIDTFAFYRDTGTAWDLIGGPGTGSLTGSGASGQVPYFTSSSILASSSNFFWDNTNKFLGIGTSTPGTALELKVLNGNGLRLVNAGSSDKTWDFVVSGNDLRINETSVVATITFEAGGNVGIGTTDPTSKLEVNGDILVSKSGDSGLNLNSTSANGVAITRYKTTAGGSLWGTGINITAADSRWEIYNYTLAQSPIVISNAGLVGISNTPAFLLDIGGGVNGVTQNTCRIGNTPGYTNGLTVAKSTSNIYTFDFGANSIIQSSYTYGNTVTSPRTVYINSAGVLGGISSLLASKTNIKQFNTKWLYDLKPIQFNYRKKDENQQYIDEFDTELFYGFIAEETELINKEICTYNNEKLIGIEYSKLVPVLVKAIQELNEKLIKNNIN